MMIFRGRGRRRSTLVSKRRRGRALNSYVSQRRRVECGSHRVINTQRERRETFCRCALFMMCVRVCERKREQRKFFLWCFFLLPPLKKREKCGHRKCRPKDKRVTKGQDGQRTDKSLISLSLSLLFRVCIVTVLLPGRREGTESPVRRRRRESSLLRVSLSLRALEMVLLFHQSESTKKASIRPRKKNKQTKDGGTKNLKKVPTWHFSASKERQILGEFVCWRRLFTKN